MKKWIFLITLFFALTSCEKKPEDLTIDNQVMAEIVADLHLAEEMLSKFRKQDKDSVRNIYIQDIATIHQIDTITIFKNIEIMQRNPKLSVAIYTDVYSILNEYGKIGKELDEKNK